MNNTQKISLFLLRLSTGWLFLYAGVSHLRDANFAAATAGYLNNAKFLTGLYHWLASPSLLPTVTALNAWGLTLVGIALILGIFTRWGAYLGMLFMLLYYLPLGILHPNAHSLIVDEHIIYFFALWVIAAFRAGRAWGLESVKRNA